MTPSLLGQLFDQFKLVIGIKPGPKQIAKVRGGGSVTQLQAGGDINVDKLLVVDANALPELRALAKRVEDLELRTQVPELPAGPPVEINATAMAIIKAYDLEGSRIHLSFEVLNRSPDRAVTERSATLTVNDCILRTKQFDARRTAYPLPVPIAKRLSATGRP